MPQLVITFGPAQAAATSIFSTKESMELAAGVTVSGFALPVLARIPAQRRRLATRLH
jgi:hypothetical protein